MIKGTAEAEGKYIKQSGGRGQYGHVWIKMEPILAEAQIARNAQTLEFVDAVKGGSIPREYIPAVEKGIKEAVVKGVLAGYPMVNVKVTLFDGSYHEVDSSEIAFKIAGSMAFQEGARKAKLVLLEPIMKVEAVTPADFMGDVVGDISSKRGHVDEITDRGMAKVIDAKVPLSEMFGYATQLRSMTQGRASYTMEFDHYEEVPRNISEEIISGKRK